MLNTPCQEAGYKASAQTDLDCTNLSAPRDNLCTTRQCCKAKCDDSPLCAGFVFGDSASNNCRGFGDGQNCCWLKGGSCNTRANPLTAAYQKQDFRGKVVLPLSASVEWVGPCVLVCWQSQASVLVSFSWRAAVPITEHSATKDPALSR